MHRFDDTRSHEFTSPISPHDAAHHPLRTAIPHANVLARLQALFPQGTQSASPSSPSPTPDTPSTLSDLPPPPPKALKIRIVTWNMHESLPKGDLTELLGAVPAYTPRLPLSDPHAFPYLPEDGNHPYHLVVVAGQECPTLSGIPLGLGAGFKLNDKERSKREKEKEKEKHRDRDKDRDRDEDGELREKDERERFRDGLRELQQRLLKEDHPDEVVQHAATGWTSILEAWFCHGETQPLAKRAKDTTASTQASAGDTPSPDRALSTGDIRRRPQSQSQSPFVPAAREPAPVRKGLGPYEMLVKERMMGLYLAIFVHRDAAHLVQGTSRAAVAAGLIGGRVGNKGAVGASVKIAGTRMLFLNAHLAAHEGRMSSRLANVAKIKAELGVDDFLPADDPRRLARSAEEKEKLVSGKEDASSASGDDVTDRFDHTFFCGDLNFRLDISRLHADWLISRAEFAQALAFDQLRGVMSTSGPEFAGFREADIEFPPTFKYDVTGRRHGHRRKRSALGLHGRKSAPVTAATSSVSVGASDLGSPRGAGFFKKARELSAEPSSDEDEEGDGEVISVGSMGTTMSRKTNAADEDYDDEDDDDDDNDDEDEDDDSESAGVGSPPHSARRLARTTGLVRSISVRAARSAKRKWRELLAPPVYVAIGGRPPSTSKSLSLSDASGSAGDAGGSRAPSTRSGRDRDADADEDEEEEADADRGVYDSSSKQRVPSWCDRILYKSTVPLGPEREDLELPHIPRTAVGTFIAHAWRALARPRKSSLLAEFVGESDESSSAASSHASPSHSSSPSQSNSSSSPLSRLSSPLSHPSSPLSRRPLSMDLGASESVSRKPLPRSQSHAVLAESLHASNSSSPSPSPPPLPSSRPPPLPPRHHTAPVPLPSFSPSPSPSPGSLSSSSYSPRSTSPTSPSELHRRFPFLPFLSPSAQTPPTLEPPPPPPREQRRRRKGEIVCFEYRTLDDRQMRRLEGRSDHRPVIGAYAVYL